MSVGLADSRFTDPQVGPSNQGQVDAINTILQLSGVALAAGAGARGLSGIGSFFNRNLGGGLKTPMRQSFVRIPVPVEVRTRAERDAMLAAADQDKEAGLVKLADLATGIADALGMLRKPNEQVGLIRDTISGWGQPGYLQKPWFPLATAAGVGTGLYGGWKLTDYLLDKTKNIEQESELEQARKDYESALAGRRKLASARPSPLDELADRYEKRAWFNELLGGAGLLGGGAALLSGLGTYHWTRSLAKDKAVEEAVRRRQAEIAEQAPSPIMAIPTPIPIYQPQHRHKLREDALTKGSAKRLAMKKVANIGQAADQFLGRIRSNQMAVWQRLMTPTDAKPAKPEKPAEPVPPQLPTLAGTRSRVMGQQPT